MIQPRIKWAGGKRQLRSELVARLPRKWRVYYEPFVGGGTPFAELNHLRLLRKAMIGDLNRELMNLYTVVRDNRSALIRELAGTGFANTAAVFEDGIREFNSRRMTRGKNARREALLVYLNKHRYNGLWQVNGRGKHNVPFGRHAGPAMPFPDALYRFSESLRNVISVNADFARTVRAVRQGDFVYRVFCSSILSAVENCTVHRIQAGRVHLLRSGPAWGYRKKLTGTGMLVMLSNSKVSKIETLCSRFPERLSGTILPGQCDL